MSELCGNRSLYFCGDIHGEIKKLVWNLVNRYKVTSSDIIICGDYGVGFSSSPKIYEDELYNCYIHKRLEKNDINIYVVRGNHDNPEWFDGNHDYPRLKFLKDHNILELSGLRIYPIGGGVSMDRKWRINYNHMKEGFGSSKRIWWENERIVRETKLPSKVDIIVSHMAPMYFRPIYTRTPSIDLDIWKDSVDDRLYLDYVFREIIFSRWIFGHYHTSITESLEGKLYKCLDIEEIFKLI